MTFSYTVRRFGLSLFLLTLVSFSAAAPLKVLSAAPRGTHSVSGRQAVTLTFNQPVTALAEATQFSQADCPLAIKPGVPGTCRYVGTQTLQFEPDEDWPAATQFTVQLKSGFSSGVSGQKLTAPYSFTFTTQTPKVTRVLPRNNERWISLTPLFYVQFNLPVSPENLLSFVTLQDSDGRLVALSARPLTEVEWEKDFSYVPLNQQAVFVPLEPLAKDKQYTLTFKQGLRAAVGNAGMRTAYTSHFFTYPSLAVQGVKNTGCLPYTPGIRFSSPVRLRELAAAIHVSPAGVMEKLEEQTLDTLGNEVVFLPSDSTDAYWQKTYQANYALTEAEIKQGAAFFFMPLSFLKLPPRQPVKITISKNLRDIYGNPLGKDYTFQITNDGYCPAAEFSGGFGVLESYLPPRLPIDLMNITSLPVRAARFNKENFIPFQTQQRSSCQPAALPTLTYDENYSFPAKQDKTSHTFLNLARFAPNGEDSIIFSQVKLPRRNGQEECWINSLSNITDVGVTFKTSARSTLIWTTSLETGAALAALGVELRDSSNRVLWSGSTDQNGLAIAPGWESFSVKKPTWGQPELYVFVSSAGGDAVLSTSLNDGLEPWRFNVPFSYNTQQEQLRTELFTERGIYRPGEKMYVKAISRRWTKQGWQYPGTLEGTLSLTDVRGTEIASQKVHLSQQGSFSAEFDIPTQVHTGMWEIAFTPQEPGQTDPATKYLSVRVEAVKQADFEVTLRPDKKIYFSGQQAAFSAAARYNFGAALAKAPAKWTLRRSAGWFSPQAYDAYLFTPYFLRENLHEENGKLVASGSGNTDENGMLSFQAALPATTTPIDIFAEVGVQSPAKQDLFARTSFTVHPGAFYIGTKVVTESPHAGKPVQADLIALTPDLKKVSARGTASIRKIQWYSVRKTGLSGRLEWVSERQEIELPSQPFEVTEKGGSFSFTPQEGGSYQVTLSALDAQGRTIQGGFETYVSGAADAYWPQQADDLLVLKQDKNSYKPGQKARIAVQSPYQEALALVTVEREGILDAWVTAVKKGDDFIEVPIKENYMPNVYVGVMLVRGRSAEPVNANQVDLGKPQGKTGYVLLQVAPEQKRLDVAVKTDKKSYRPGEEVTVLLSAKANRKPVPAEVTVMVVDEGVLALTNYQTPDLFKQFYQSRDLSVFTADNRFYVVGQRNFGEKGENRGGGGGADFKLGGTDLRSHFSFVPYFKAAVQTNAKGRAEVSFKLPDNLTKFRIMAVAATQENFGSAQTAVSVSKPLMISANLPRLVRAGDEFDCGAVVYNYEDKKGNLTVSAHAAGAVELTPETKNIQVPLGSAQTVTWKCKALQPGAAQVSFRLQGRGKETDGVLAKLAVQPVEKMQTLMMYGSTQTSREELVEKPASVNVAAQNQVEFSLASTALLQLKGALNYLMNYPFNCLEQQLSKSVPVISAEKLIRDFSLGDVKELKQKAQDVFNQLEMYQAPSGGFGYWKNPQWADPYLTSYALEIAFRAQKQGYQVSQAVLQKAADWLAQAFNAQTRRAYTYSLQETQIARAYEAYVLALYGKNTDAIFNNLYANRTTLPVPALAYLLKEAHLVKRAESLQKTLAQQLINRATYTPTAVYFSTPQEWPWLHVDEVVSTALALEALLETKQPFEQAYQSVSWMLGQLNAQGHWNSTQANALTLEALNLYYQQQEQAEPDFAAQVTQGMQTWLADSFKGRSEKTVQRQVAFEEVYSKDSQARLTFSKQGPGTLYYTLSQVYAPKQYDRPVNAGMEVSRRLTTLTGEPVEKVQAGQRYQVILTVRTAQARHFVVLEDFIPGGFEIVNTSLSTESTQLQNQLAQQNEESFFLRNEKYEGSLAAFADYLPAGTHTYSYAVSALNAGTFAWPSAWVSQMYDPAVFGRNATSRLTIE